MNNLTATVTIINKKLWKVESPNREVYIAREEDPVDPWDNYVMYPSLDDMYDGFSIHIVKDHDMKPYGQARDEAILWAFRYVNAAVEVAS